MRDDALRKRVKRLASNEIELGIEIPTIESQASNIPMTKGTAYVVMRFNRCRSQNWRILGRGSRTVHLRLMVTGSGGHDVYPGSGPLDGGNTLLPA